MSKSMHNYPVSMIEHCTYCGSYGSFIKYFINKWNCMLQLGIWSTESKINFKLINNSNMTSFFRCVNKRAICRLGIISLAHAPVHVTDFPVVNVHVAEWSSARIWQHKLCATYSANVNINNRLPIKAYYHSCTLRHIRNEIIHGSQNVLWVLTWVGGY
jgi:hypothetical protein